MARWKQQRFSLHCSCCYYPSHFYTSALHVSQERERESAIDPCLFSFVLLNVSLCILCSIFYSRHRSSLDVWIRQGIPVLSFTESYGIFLTVFSKDFYKIDLARRSKYGKMCGFASQGKPSLVIFDPEVIKEVTVKNFHLFTDRNRASGHKIFDNFLTGLSGPAWKRMRTIISPTFSSGKIKAMKHLIDSSIDDLIIRLNTDINSGKTEFDVKTLFGNLTMDVIARCAFALDVKDKETNSDLNKFATMAKRFLTFPPFKIFLAILIPRFLTKVRAAVQLFDKEATDFLMNVASTVIEKRKENSAKGQDERSYTDFIQLMMEAAQDDVINSPSDSSASSSVSGENNISPSTDQKVSKHQPLTKDEIIANAILILIAGYETTASLLTFTSYLLAINPQEQEKVRSEIKSAFGDGEERLDYEKVMSLTYLDAVICETLRLYPPVLRVDRHSNSDVTLESTGTFIPKGSPIVIPIYAIHHLEEFYPQPEVFKPDRFLPQNKDQLIPYTWLPFVTGPRNCVGMRFALLEAKLTLCRLLLQFKFVKSDKTSVPIDLSSTTVLLNPKSVVVAMEPL